MNIKRFVFYTGRYRMFTQSEAHCLVKSNGFLSRTAGCVQGRSPAASCIIRDSFNQPSSDSAPSELTRNMKTVNDKAILVKFRYQHDFTNDRISLKCTECNISAWQYLSRLFASQFGRPGFGKGLVIQNEFAVLYAPNILNLLKSIKWIHWHFAEIVSVRLFDFNHVFSHRFLFLSACWTFPLAPNYVSAFWYSPNALTSQPLAA